MRTHPVTTNRIADSRNRAEQYSYRQIPESIDFYHLRAKIQAQAPGNPDEIVRGFKDNLVQGKYRNVDAERYGYTLVLLRTRQLAAARNEIQKLIQRQPNKPAYRIVQAEIEMAAENYPQALAIYATANAKNPSNLSLLRYYADALLKANRPRQAKDLLKTALRLQPDDPVLYKMLAQAAGSDGNRLEAHKALAEHYYLNGDPNAAIEQLQIATRFAGDSFYLQSSLEARIHAIKEEMPAPKGK